MAMVSQKRLRKISRLDEENDRYFIRSAYNTIGQDPLIDFPSFM